MEENKVVDEIDDDVFMAQRELETINNVTIDGKVFNPMTEDFDEFKKVKNKNNQLIEELEKKVEDEINKHIADIKLD